MKKIFLLSESLKNNILIILGLVILSYILFLRVFLKRLPREINPDLNIIIKILFIELCFIFFLYFCMNIWKTLITFNYYIPRKNYSDKIGKIKLFIYLKNILKIWTDSLLAVHNFLIKKYALYYNFLNNLGTFLEAKIRYYKSHWLIIILDFLPKIIVLFYFLLDIFFFTQFNYFYKTSVLLLIPLITRYLVFSLNDNYVSDIHDTDNFLIIFNKNMDIKYSAEDYYFLRLKYKHNFDYSKYIFTFTDKFLQSQKDNKNTDFTGTLDKFMYTFNCEVIDPKLLIHRIEMWRDVVLPIFNIFLYGLYFIGWLYVLYLVFKL